MSSLETGWRRVKWFSIIPCCHYQKRPIPTATDRWYRMPAKTLMVPEGIGTLKFIDDGSPFLPIRCYTGRSIDRIRLHRLKKEPRVKKDPADIAAVVGQYDQLAIDTRRRLHRIPEVGFKEKKTSAYVIDYLTREGLPVTTGIAGTGVMALLETGRPGPTLLIRADMDALPITEATGLSWLALQVNTSGWLIVTVAVVVHPLSSVIVIV